MPQSRPAPTTGSRAHHILPVRLYVTTGGVLLLLTLVTVVVARFDFGTWNLVFALSIAAVKASLVALYFMHLKYDGPLYGILFVLAITFLALFIIFTMFDTQRRADLYPTRATPIRAYAVIYDEEGRPLPLSARHFGRSQGKTAGGPSDDLPFGLRHGYGPITEVIDLGPIDTARALRGKPIFESKCATCHKLDERYTGPPLRGVTAYRSATFIMNQILDPAQNVAKHPDMQAMLKTYYTIMTNQNVSRDEAQTLVEYLRWEAGRAPGQ